MNYGKEDKNMTLTQIQLEINKLVRLVNQMTGTFYPSIIIDDINELLIQGYRRARVCSHNEIECWIVFKNLLWNKYDSEMINSRVSKTDHPWIQIPDAFWYDFRAKYPDRYILAYSL